MDPIISLKSTAALTWWSRWHALFGSEATDGEQEHPLRRTASSGAIDAVMLTVELSTISAGTRAGPHGNLTTQRDRNQALIRRCGEDTGARRLAPRLGG